MTTSISPAERQTDLYKIFYQCRLGKGDLERLTAMACEGIPLPEVKIATKAGHTQFWKPTLLELVDTVHDEAPEINTDWTNLTVEASTPSSERGVKIVIDGHRTQAYTFGSDTTWAFGQIARIEKFLISRGAVFSSPKYENTIMYIAALLFVGFGTFLTVHGIEDDSVADCIKRANGAGRNAAIDNTLIIVTYAFGTLFPLYQILKRRTLRARLNIKEDLPTGFWWSRLSTTERFVAIGIPIATLAMIGTLVTAANNLWGK